MCKNHINYVYVLERVWGWGSGGDGSGDEKPLEIGISCYVHFDYAIDTFFFFISWFPKTLVFKDNVV